MYGRAHTLVMATGPRDHVICAALSLVIALGLLSAAPFWWQYLPGQSKPEVAWPAAPAEPDKPVGLANPWGHRVHGRVRTLHRRPEPMAAVRCGCAYRPHLTAKQMVTRS